MGIYMYLLEGAEDMVTCVRRELWKQWFFQTDQETTPFSKLPSLLQETILYALAPAA